LIKNSHPFGKKCQRTAWGDFLTHTVEASLFLAKPRDACESIKRVCQRITIAELSCLTMDCCRSNVPAALKRFKLTTKWT